MQSIGLGKWSDLINIANGDGGEVDVTEGRRRRIHRRHHRRFVELHALQKKMDLINHYLPV